ncbi:TIGR00153 family protein [Zooshikella harenae]|uniref:TIGR00153 family protein n=1 Tax=Zooshikella harenae TaxID=2827238 RepID=A0ABS5ZDV9_9GAMM|nr:TIGR00153 family protein [Zooshikella harenae]MBU2711918.1 TIGR00153 family protein [Zooshikella harenae]
MIKSVISELFAKSPFGPMQQHMDIVLSCVKLLEPFFKSVMGRDWDKAENFEQQMINLEHEADLLKREILSRLPSGVLTPVPREILFNLIYQQDAAANTADDIVGRITARQVNIPSALQPSITSLLNLCIEAVKLTHQSVSELDELLELGFRGKESVLVQKIIDSLEEHEDKIRSQVRSTRRTTHSLESELSALDAITLYQMIDRLDELARTARNIAMCLEVMLVKL